MSNSQPTWNHSTSNRHDNYNEPDLVLSNRAYTLPNTTYEKTQWESDAQIAARKAMAKRSSRSYSKRVSRTKSRKRDMIGRPAKPTIDTSFSRHKGALPRQIYPRDNDLKYNASVKKSPWFGLGRSGTRGRGLGIMKGTPQPGNPAEDFIAPTNQEPRTADALSPGTMTWMEISPSDRPIPIGISLPTDSLPDLSPYQTTRPGRNRSESDTLVTPSIIITPAAAMKSVWSPDTASDYTNSIYSRGTTYRPFSNMSDVPPVPALPAGVMNSSNMRFGQENSHNAREEPVSRPRNGTLDSAGTTFDDIDFDSKRKDRIMSSSTVFEEDETPLRERNTQASVLSINTAVTPSARQSQGWWNFITTPFEFSRANSIWTQNGRNAEKTPDIPMVPQRFGGFLDSPNTASTYIWSATEKSPSVNNTPMIPIALSADVEDSNEQERQLGSQSAQKSRANFAPVTAFNKTSNITGGTVRVAQGTTHYNGEQATHYHNGESPAMTDRDVASPLSAMSASPVVGTAAIGTVLMPRQVTEHQPQPQQQSQQYQHQPQQSVNVNIVFQDGRPNETVQKTLFSTSTNDPSAKLNLQEQPGLPVSQTENSAYSRGPSPSPPQFAPPPTQPVYGALSAPLEIRLDGQHTNGKNPQDAPPQFPPPPQFAQARSFSNYVPSSRASSVASTSELKGHKEHRKHRKVFNLMEWLPFGWGNRRNKHQKKEMSRRKKWCWGCCCCLIILVLLAIIIPVVVVLSRKNNSGPDVTSPPSGPSQGIDAPSQWLNLTGYPPIPTGVSTIAQPEAVEEENGCIAPATSWSCALPKEEHEGIKPNKPDQPNLRFEITSDNGTVTDPSKTLPSRRAANAVSAGAFIRSLFLKARAAPPASPAPPSTEDYKFLSETTDNNQTPFEGEKTPFFISFLESQKETSSRLAKRADEPRVNLTSSIPPPKLNPDGTAAPATLFPLASGQPLRLFNRGTEDEHYGFFVYYDRSIFLKESVKNFTRGGNPADQDGGSPREAATVQCTWAQTRFLVQIWTNPKSERTLLGSSSKSNEDPAFKRPGSFPYPVTVTIDRHGGTAKQKMAYCYKMEEDGTIIDVSQNKQFLREDRSFAGSPVNPGQGPERNVTGPIDGGTGGCRCQWQNWLA